MTANRRTFCTSSLAGLLTLAGAPAALAAPASEKPLESFAEPFSRMRAQDHGASTYRPICEGITAVGARVEVHETTLNPGAEPHPPHRHKHEEFLMMVKGQVEVTIDGASTVLGPGSCGFWKSMALHHARNIGQEVAQYFVVSVGTDS